ncbi:MAG: CRISPR-associated endonuclease Cas1 [Verrucomicrobiota bacterium]
MMSSERLGVVAKMDLIEVQMTTVPQDPSPWISSPPDPALAPPEPPSPRTAKKPKRDAGQPDLFTPETAKLSQAEAPQPALIPPATRLLHVELKQSVIQKVTPVDYKAGSPRLGEDAHELWDADKMQLGLQILILRDNGYTCDEGVIYYRATKQRVKLAMTPEVEAWIIQQISAARKLAASPTIPPPLVNSPKCVRCSLAPVCLPDETRLLTSALAVRSLRSPASSPRRLIAARDDERALYLNTQGYRVGLKSERLIIKDGDSVIDEIRLNDVTHVSLFGNIQLSTQAIQELCQQEIPVAYFSMGGWFYGLTRGHGLKNVHTRIRQFALASNPLHCLSLAQKIVQAKIRNHRTMLMRLHVQPPAATVLGLKEISSRVPGARGLDELLGMEGAAAALYFQNFAGMIKVGAEDLDDEIPGLDIPASAQAKLKTEAATFTFDFTQRRRRPPTDPVNSLLSLAYSLLAKDCTIAALAVGFDPYVGFYHQPRHGRPALALDLMEEFRPLIAESAVLTAINNRMITPGHFVRAGDAVNLTPHGRKAFFHAYEQRMNTLITHPVFDYKVSYRRVLELQARLLARCLTGEIPEYVPMVTR